MCLEKCLKDRKISKKSISIMIENKGVQKSANPCKTKNTVPAAIALSAKTVFLVRLQGFEPWTP